MKNITYVILILIFNTLLCSAQEVKLTKLLPPNTEFISQKEDTSQEFMTIIQYKYQSRTTKERIVDFYRRLFTNEGFIELEGYSPEKKPPPPQQQVVYFFSKPNNLAILSMLYQPQDNSIIYYISLHKPNIEAIKKFNIDEEK